VTTEEQTALVSAESRATTAEATLRERELDLKEALELASALIAYLKRAGFAVSLGAQMRIKVPEFTGDLIDSARDPVGPPDTDQIQSAPGGVQ
jgi:hypothetical protein